MNRIEEYLRRVRARVNRALAVRVLVAALAAGMVAALITAIVYRVQGYAVPWEASGYPLIGAAVVALLVWFVRFRNLDDSARAADAHFGLKDSLLSALHFGREGRRGEVYELQRAATERRIASADPRTMPFRLPKRALVATVLGAGAVAWLASLPASEAVQKRLAAEEALEERTNEAAEELEEFVEELLEDLDEEEREVIDPEELKKWVRELQGTNDERDALRQFAKLEQKLTKAMAGLEAKQDEEVLKLAAAELDGAELAELREIAKLLEAKEFKLAEKELRELEHKEGDPRDRKNMENFKKLREATKRMAAGANKGRFAKAGRKGNPGKGKNGRPNDGAAQPADGLDQQAMDELLGELDEAAGELMEGLEDLELVDGELLRLERGLEGELGKLGMRLRKLDAKKRMRARLSAMRAGLGQSQSFAMGESQMLRLAQSAGGLQAGVGSVESRREGRDELKDNGNMAQLKGQHGKGPSERTVEEADSGTGVASRTGAAREREFRKTFESFVHRDDVPEPVKIGVREYFERIHELELEEPTTPPTE